MEEINPLSNQGINYNSSAAFGSYLAAYVSQIFVEARFRDTAVLYDMIEREDHGKVQSPPFGIDFFGRRLSKIEYKIYKGEYERRQRMRADFPK